MSLTKYDTFKEFIKNLKFEIVNDGNYDTTGNGYCSPQWWISVKFMEEEINKIPIDRIVAWIEENEEDINDLRNK